MIPRFRRCTRRVRPALCAAVCFTSFAGLAATAGPADAAGLNFSDRGVRPLARGGAFVAGADDVGAIWYNPAGLADAGSSVLADFSWLRFSSQFTRQTQVADSGGTLRVYDYPTVEGSSPILPLPTIGGSYNFGRNKEFTVGAGIFAPYTAITSYPLTLNGQPSPSRYSLVSLDGSALVTTGGWIAFKPEERIRLGLGIEMLTGSFRNTVVFSTSPSDRLIGAPEDPKYDAFSQLNVGPIFAPSANLGVIFIPEKHVRVGLSGQLPFIIDAPAEIDVRLPTAAPFDKAYQEGKDATVRFKLPAMLRLGVEVRPIPELRLELTYVREFWSAHESIEVTSKNIKLYGITGFPSPFGVAPITIQRNFQDSNSFRLGGEYSLKISDYQLDLRAGANYETSAIPVEYVSPLTIDLDKVTVAAGGGLHLGKSKSWRLDAVVAFVISPDLEVPARDAKVGRVNPVRGNPTTVDAVNGGKYSAQATVLGVGLNYKF